MSSDKKIFNLSEFPHLDSWEPYTHIIEWIEKNPIEFIESSQQEIVEKIFSSQSTVSRFSKKLFFKNFRDLQIYVAKKIEHITPQNEFDILNMNSIDNIKINVLNQYSNLTKIVFNTTDNKVLTKMGDDIFNAEITVVFGIGSSGEGAKHLRKQLRKIGIICLAMSSIHDFFDCYDSLKNKKVNFILISKSFENLEVLKIKSILDKDNRNYTIITKNPKIEISENINLVKFGFFKQESFIMDLSTKLALYMIIDIVFLYLINKVDPKNNIAKESYKRSKQWNNIE